MIDDFDAPPALGTVLDEGRGSLPFALVHGESLVAAAAWSLGEAGVVLVDRTTTRETIVATEESLVLHDSLCPMAPPAFLARCLEVSRERGAVVVGVRPVTDTVKVVADGVVGATLDRSGLLSVASPVVLPPAVVAALDGPPGTDLAVLAHELAARFPVLSLEAPPEARRVSSPEEVRLLEALTLG